MTEPFGAGWDTELILPSGLTAKTGAEAWRLTVNSAGLAVCAGAELFTLRPRYPNWMVVVPPLGLRVAAGATPTIEPCCREISGHRHAVNERRAATQTRG
jgi:hypothetical protein